MIGSITTLFKPIPSALKHWPNRFIPGHQHDERLKLEITRLLGELYEVCGWKSRLAAAIVGRYLFHQLKQEQARLEKGWTYELPTFWENTQPTQLGKADYVHGVAARLRASGGSPETTVSENPLSRAG